MPLVSKEKSLGGVDPGPFERLNDNTAMGKL
jgi:hypothetical protein